MPFTFSHPALVLPLNYLPKKWFSLTALVVGSMVPDFEYFLRMKVSGIYGHTFAGIFWFDLPLGILIAFVFHNLVKESLIRNLPTILKSRFLHYNEINWNNYFRKHFFIVTFSMLIGISSHLLWDGFTHEHGYFTNYIPFLQQHVLLFKQIPVYKILQHGSTLIGALVIFYAIYTLPVVDSKQYKSDKRYWPVVVSVSIVFIIFRMLFFTENSIGNLIVSTIAVLMVALIITPFLLKIKPVETQ
jgi:uncharacterized protein DUF4184